MVNESKESNEERVVGQLPDSEQYILINSSILDYINSYRQLRPRAKESGGQLFGTISPKRVEIIAASGPYAGDKRSRYSYRSDEKAAQKAIELHSKNGLIYLGEWHTHAEDRPRASSLDHEAMNKILFNSKLNTNTLLMLIIGRLKTTDGLSLWTVSQTRAVSWFLTSTKEKI